MAGQQVDLGFGFNDTAFSDRVLHIEVIKECLDLLGDCPSNKDRPRKDLEKENVVEVKTIHICSLILAASSPFFHKLFKNGMKESLERDVTLRVHESEVGAMIEIIKFVYSNTLSASTPDLLGVLMVADKFEVTSCMKYCIGLLKEKPMLQESALSYLELPASVSLSEVVQPLIVAAKEYLAARYSDFNKCRKEVMDLPLSAVEAVLGSNGLQVDSADDVFAFILEWAREHYPTLEERREILTKRLAQCIKYPYMSCSKLKEVLVCPDFVHEEVSKLVIEALFVKVKVPHLQHINASKDVDLPTTNFSSLVRSYKLRPIQVVPIEFPQPRCIVYFDLKKEECENLVQSPSLCSESFCLGGRVFYLEAKYHPSREAFGLFVHMTKESESVTLDTEFAAMKLSSKEFQNEGKFKANNSELLLGCGFFNLFNTTWNGFLSMDSEYFIDGILHLRVDLTINNGMAS